MAALAARCDKGNASVGVEARAAVEMLATRKRKRAKRRAVFISGPES
jgi:hypothetical protein